MSRCWLLDIDGTVADATHRLHHIEKEPKDWRSFFAEVPGDKPIPHVVEICQVLEESGYDIVFVTGRSTECREATIAWLDENVVRTYALYMRQEGDHRPDEVVKIELLAKLREDGYEPVAAFEDRARVARALREAGLPVFHVAEGEF